PPTACTSAAAYSGSVVAPSHARAGNRPRRADIGSRAVRAVQIVNLEAPDRALELVDVPEPEPSHMLTPGRGVVVDVHAAGVSFPEVLQSRGEFQLRPDLPFVPASVVGGVVRRGS